MKVGNQNIKGRDWAGAAVGLLSGGLGGLGGAAAKKFLVKEGDSFKKRFLVGLATTVLTGGTGLLPYLITSPGEDTKKAVQQTRGQVASQHYNGLNIG